MELFNLWWSALNTRGTLFKALNRAFGKALHAYDMIQEGDRIAVGFSGGKDSWALLWLLTERLPRIPITYTLFPIHIDVGFGSSAPIQQNARHMGWEVRIEQTDFGVLAHSDINRENPCFLCARNRRQRLFEIADELGCNKLALGHNKDDLIETLFLNMLYAGEMSTMLPKQALFQGRLTAIRPLVYVDEEALTRFAASMGWPLVGNACPSAGRSKRAHVKQMLQTLYGGDRKIKGNIFRALRHVKPDYLPK
ncbi:MAG: tRNA 2-thiocytidine(32) synthetase TtcA [Desulfobacteraceae bacterium]|nr:MAG: tRNA 2-thiocytidine(32) synthetase TtcA [Desulfobacteraceae bacterium]